MANDHQIKEKVSQRNISSFKKWVSLFLILLLLLVAYWFLVERRDIESRLQDGDIIFQTSSSAQSEAIQIVTKSRYSHMGMVYQYKGNFHVFEATQPVQSTPLKEWIDRGEKGHFVVKRLRDADTILTPEIKYKMFQIAMGFLGRNYDLTFSWDDQRLYCSEAIWKLYKRGAGVEIGKLQRLGDFDLSHPIVAQKIKERYGTHVPLDEIVISPQAIYESELLKTVIRNDRFLGF